MGRVKMPTSGIPFIVGKYQNKNDKMPEAYGKWYGRPVVLSTLDVDDMAEHIQDHGCVYGTDLIKAVLEKFFDCALELLFQNRRVKMNGLGTLYMACNSEGAASAEDFTVDQIKSLRPALLPDSSKQAQLSGEKLRSRMQLSTNVSSSFVSTNGTPAAEEGEGGEG